MAVEILGSINVDIVAELDRLPCPGETVIARNTLRLPGGKGANQAVAAARMGADTQMIGAIGDDADGSWMLGLLADAAIDIAAIGRREGMATGTAHIAVDRAGENQIIVAPGANSAIAAADLPAPNPAARVLLAQLETPLDTVAAFLAADRAAGRLRLLNAAPALPETIELFGDVDILVVNEHELACYLAAAGVRDGGDPAAVRRLFSRSDQAAIVTLGARGACLVTVDALHHEAALPVTPVDTVGAGDCFTGALAALLDDGTTPVAALPIANAAAALCTLERGAIPSMPRRAAVEALLAGAAS